MRSSSTVGVRTPVVDTAVAIVLAVAACLTAFVEHVDEPVRPFGVLAAALVLGMTLPLAARRQYPRTVALVAVGCASVALLVGYPVGLGGLGALFALYSLAHTVPQRDTILVGVPAGLALLGALAGEPNWSGWTSMATNTLVISFALVVGGLVHVRKEQYALLAQRNRELDEAREAQTLAAVMGERMRIARDVHDAVGHALVAITLQARAGQRRLGRNPERVGEVLKQIEDLASHALQETRTAVATIRGAQPPAAPKAPPALADLAGLVESMRAPDLDVCLTVSLAGHDPDPELQTAAYRIVQESLSNTVKHARPARAEVLVAHDAEALTVEVVDHGGSVTNGSGDTGTTPAGSGIQGMQERIQALGGTLQAGPTSTGWRVAASLPSRREQDSLLA